MASLRDKMYLGGTPRYPRGDVYPKCCYFLGTYPSLNADGGEPYDVWFCGLKFNQYLSATSIGHQKGAKETDDMDPYFGEAYKVAQKAGLV